MAWISTNRWVPGKRRFGGQTIGLFQGQSHWVEAREDGRCRTQGDAWPAKLTTCSHLHCPPALCGANTLQGAGGQTPLMMAVLQGKVEMVKVALAADADTTIGENDGYTAVHGASFQGRPKIMEMLIAHGLDPNDKVRRAGRLEWNPAASPPLLSLWLTVFGAAQHNDGFTPIHRATWGTTPGHSRLPCPFAGRNPWSVREHLGHTLWDRLPLPICSITLPSDPNLCPLPQPILSLVAETVKVLLEHGVVPDIENGADKALSYKKIAGTNKATARLLKEWQAEREGRTPEGHVEPPTEHDEF